MEGFKNKAVSFGDHDLDAVVASSRVTPSTVFCQDTDTHDFTIDDGIRNGIRLQNNRLTFLDQA